jgi:hypothetical protein
MPVPTVLTAGEPSMPEGQSQTLSLSLAMLGYVARWGTARIRADCLGGQMMGVLDCTAGSGMGWDRRLQGKDCPEYGKGVQEAGSHHQFAASREGGPSGIETDRDGHREKR